MSEPNELPPAEQPAKKQPIVKHFSADEANAAFAAAEKERKLLRSSGALFVL